MGVTSTPVLAIQKNQKAFRILDFDGFLIDFRNGLASVLYLASVNGLLGSWIWESGFFIIFGRALGFCVGYLQVTPIWAGGWLVPSNDPMTDGLVVMCCNFSFVMTRDLPGTVAGSFPDDRITSSMPVGWIPFRVCSLGCGGLSFFFKLSKDVKRDSKCPIFETLWIRLGREFGWATPQCDGNSAEDGGPLPNYLLWMLSAQVSEPFSSGRFLINWLWDVCSPLLMLGPFWKECQQSLAILQCLFWIFLAETKHRYPAIAAMLYSFAHADRCFGHSASGQDQNERPGDTLLPVERRWC